ncbi:MAG: [Clostridia bacterium]|nr:[FeFe] hydrogenase H-cluster maturation GTPase HydF [Clostridia bacterium]
MSILSSVPASERVHIAFFGNRNAGKSSLVNAVTGQDLSVVSDVAGTTTDPVTKSMELLPLGPVLIIDTPGYDDVGSLGELRVARTKKVIRKTDIAVICIDSTVGITESDREMLELIKKRSLPYIVALTKHDLTDGAKNAYEIENAIEVSAKSGYNIHELKEKIAALAREGEIEKRPLADLCDEGDVIVLVTPIDESAPKGRLILPQQLVLRDALDRGAVAITTQVEQLGFVLGNLKNPPKMVITDSQVFGAVSKIVPESIPLTSFSIIMALYKGFLHTAVRAIGALDSLKDGDTVLIAEGCTHHRQCNDIGTVKIPRWLRAHVGADISIESCSGNEFPDDLSRYAMVIHCGGCMLNEKEVLARMNRANEQGVPFTNYGTFIAHVNGILSRSLEIFNLQ